MKPEPSESGVNTDPIYQFYNDHPYPPPVDNLDRAREMWKGENVLRAEFHLLWPHKEYRPDFDLLVAGCGTWQAARYALTHPAARVVAIDLSPTSLEHTNALKQKHNLTNLETRQLSVENAANLGQRFDLIVCTGVLHHLVDPDEGLRALRSVLTSEGALYFMVYAPYGRAGVYMLQEYCRRLGVGTSQQEINDLIAVLQQLPQHHPLLSTQGGSKEVFNGFNGDALADALLNPRERSYSVSQLFDFIDRNDLRFGRWYLQASYLPQCGDIASTPHAERLATLPELDQYIEMELWRGLMSNHSVVVYRNEINDDFKVRFDDDQYLQYVPIRMAWTICVQDRLPPEAAAALINQTHRFNDLYLLIDAQQKQIFDAIDGRRSISEIVETVKVSAPLARDFFQELWRYDQAVFDTSATRR